MFIGFRAGLYVAGTIVICQAMGMWATTNSLAVGAVVSDLPSLGALDDFAVFGKTVNLANAIVHGDVGVSTNGKFTLMGPSTVEGSVHLDAGVDKTLTGAYGLLYEPVDVSTARQQAFDASTVLRQLTPALTYSTWTSPLTLPGNGGVNVINVGDVDLNSESVVLTGGPNDIFIINVSGAFSLNGTGGIIAGSGMDASRIFTNIWTTGSKVTTKVDNQMDGSLLIPYRAAEFNGIFSGAVYGGDSEIKFMGGTTIGFSPFSVHEPTALSVFVLAGIAAALSWRPHHIRQG